MTVLLNDNKKTARLAGFLFICVCVPLAIWGMSYVPSKIFVPGDPRATAQNLLSNEFIFRTSIVSHLVSTVVFAFVVVLLHRLFSSVDRYLSQIMVAALIVQFPVVIIFEVVNFTALTNLKGETRPFFEAAARQEVSYFLLRIHRNGIAVAQLIFGICFIPFGMLVLRSKIIPRIFGILLIISGIGYIADCCTFLLLQRPDYLVVRQIVAFAFAGFIMTMLWLLVKGAKNNLIEESVKE